MRIDINFQSLAWNVKYKTISNPLEKRKNDFHSRPIHTEIARDSEARSCQHFCENAPTLSAIHPTTMQPIPTVDT